MSAVAAKGFRRNWLELDAYLINILRVLNAEGLHDNELSERQHLLPISAHVHQMMWGSFAHRM